MDTSKGVDPSEVSEFKAGGDGPKPGAGVNEGSGHQVEAGRVRTLTPSPLSST